MRIAAKKKATIEFLFSFASTPHYLYFFTQCALYPFNMLRVCSLSRDSSTHNHNRHTKQYDELERTKTKRKKKLTKNDERATMKKNMQFRKYFMHFDVIKLCKANPEPMRMNDRTEEWAKEKKTAFCRFFCRLKQTERDQIECEYAPTATTTIGRQPTTQFQVEKRVRFVA